MAPSAGRWCVHAAFCVAVLAPLAGSASPFGKAIPDMVGREAGTGWPVGRVPFGIAFYVRSGILVTAAHVVAGCRTVEIMRPGRGAVAASILLSDPDNDIAVLRTDAGSSTPGRLARIAARPGDRLMRPDLMPIGLEAVTVSRLARGLGPELVIMLTGMFVPGMSGSPLLDRDGAIAGMLVGRIATAGVAIRATEITADLRRITVPPGSSRLQEAGFVRLVRCAA